VFTDAYYVTLTRPDYQQNGGGLLQSGQLVQIRRLTTTIRSERCVVRRFRRCANVTEGNYTNLDSIAYYTPRLYGTAYCS